MCWRCRLNHMLTAPAALFHGEITYSIQEEALQECFLKAESVFRCNAELYSQISRRILYVYRYRLGDAKGT